MLVWFSNGYFAIPEKRILNIDKRWTRSIESTSFMVRSSTNFFFLLFQHLKNFWAQIYCRSVEFAVETKGKNVANIFHISFLANINIFSRISFSPRIQRAKESELKNITQNHNKLLKFIFNMC